MKASLGFDPRAHAYGPATASVQSVLLAWEQIDWFEPSGTSDEDATRLFREHNARAHAYAPELFAENIDVQLTSGSWPEFNALCQRVRATTSWDWKFSVLKPLSVKQARAHGWTLEAEAQRVPSGPPQTGELFFRIGNAVGQEVAIWHIVSELDGLDSLPGETARDSASFYVSYAHADALDCIQWQLAARQNDLQANPFWSLLHCYRAGLHPFSLDRTTVQLFRFSANE